MFSLVLLYFILLGQLTIARSAEQRLCFLVTVHEDGPSLASLVLLLASLSHQHHPTTIGITVDFATEQYRKIVGEIVEAVAAGGPDQRVLHLGNGAGGSGGWGGISIARTLQRSLRRLLTREARCDIVINASARDFLLRPLADVHDIVERATSGGTVVLAGDTLESRLAAGKADHDVHLARYASKGVEGWRKHGAECRIVGGPLASLRQTVPLAASAPLRRRRSPLANLTLAKGDLWWGALPRVAAYDLAFGHTASTLLTYLALAPVPDEAWALSAILSSPLNHSWSSTKLRRANFPVAGANHPLTLRRLNNESASVARGGGSSPRIMGRKFDAVESRSLYAELIGNDDLLLSNAKDVLRRLAAGT